MSARIKGTALRGVLRYLKQNGADPSAILRELPAASRAAFEARILASGWYPYPAYLDLLETVDRTVGRADLSLMPVIGDWLATQDLGMLFKFVTTFASIERLARRCPLFWGQHCDTGTLECTVMDTRGQRAKAEVREVPGLRPAHCRLVGGWVRGMCEGAGLRGMVVTQVECVCEGAPACRYEGSWSS